MAKRSNHYEAAFEQFLRERGVPCVAVNEARRSTLADASLKSLDFVVSRPGGGTWLVDVKGRHFPAGNGRKYWKNWSTQDDLRSLASWQQLFGPESEALFVFAYQVVGDRAPLPADQMFAFRGAWYGFVGVRLRDFAQHARVISPKWQTLAMPARLFRELAEPLDHLLDESAARSESAHDAAFYESTFMPS